MGTSSLQDYLETTRKLLARHVPVKRLHYKIYQLDREQSTVFWENVDRHGILELAISLKYSAVTI